MSVWLQLWVYVSHPLSQKVAVTRQKEEGRKRVWVDVFIIWSSEVCMGRRNMYFTFGERVDWYGNSRPMLILTIRITIWLRTEMMFLLVHKNTTWTKTKMWLCTDWVLQVAVRCKNCEFIRHNWVLSATGIGGKPPFLPITDIGRYQYWANILLLPWVPCPLTGCFSSPH